MNPVVFYLWLLGVTCSLAGVQFVYSIQFAVGTPFFCNQFKLTASEATYILATAGPISGFIVQPIVGTISDSYTGRLGRRRPFILAGVIGCVIGMAILGNSVSIGAALGDKKDSESTSDHKIGLIFSVFGLWVLNLFTNVLQGPARAIVADIVPEESQQAGNAMVSGVMGLAAVIANVIGAQVFHEPEPYKILFLIGCGFIILSCIPTMIICKEQVYVEVGEKKNKSIGGVFIRIFRGFRYMPGSLYRIAILYFFSWCAFSPFMIYSSTFFGVNVYGGTIEAPSQTGLQMAMYGLAIFAFVQWLFSVILPKYIDIAGVKGTYISTQLVATVCYILFAFYAHPLVVPLVLLAGVAPNFTTFNSIPFALIGNTGKEDAGLYMGVLNSAAVISQTVANFMAGAIIHKYNDVKWGIAFGGIFSVIACILVLIIQTPSKEKEDIEKTPLLAKNESNIQ